MKKRIFLGILIMIILLLILSIAIFKYIEERDKKNLFNEKYGNY